MQVLRARHRRPRAVVLLAAARTTPAPRVPEGSRAMAGIGCHFMAIWMDRSTITFTQMGGEGVPWVGQAAVHERQAHLRQPRRRHLLPQRPAGDPPEHRRRRQHHLQDPLQRRGRDDRRPAGRRAARGPLGAADHEEPARRGRGEARHRHRRAREVRRRHARAPASPCTTATSSTASSASSASSRAPPSIIYDQTCATEKRRRRKRGTLVDAGQARRHQRAGLRRLRRLQRAEQLPDGRAGRDRVRPQAPHQPEHLQQGLLAA